MMKTFFTILALLFCQNLHAAVVYQGASATLTSTPSVVTYTTKMPLLATPVYYITTDGSGVTTLVDISTTPDDNNYSGGIYTCSSRGTYSVGASIAISGTIALGSVLAIGIEVSNDAGVTWTKLRTVKQALPAGIPSSSAYVAFLVPCALGGKIRITSYTTAALPTLSTTPDENALSITRVF